VILGTTAGLLTPVVFPRLINRPTRDAIAKDAIAKPPSPVVVSVAAPKKSAEDPPPENPPPENPAPQNPAPEELPPPPPPLRPARPTPKSIPPRPQSLADEVNLAIDRGVVYLHQYAERVQPASREVPLVGLALLECGVPPNDPVIERLAEGLRNLAAEDRQNYEISLQLLFFDCLGKKEDEPLIRHLAKLLMQRQFENGTWTYRGGVLPQRPTAPEPPPDQGPLSIIQSVPGKGKGRPAPVRPFDLLGVLAQGTGDHSNTQFAALALWVAARHGVQVQGSLARTDAHFREVQNSDGSWGYTSGSSAHRDSMTCAGLMSLAIGHAVEQPAPNGSADLVIIQGSAKFGKNGALPARPTAMARGLAVLAKTLKPAPGNRTFDSLGQLYFLWSLERMAVIYQIDTIGECTWYPWAARKLVDGQSADGSWRDTYPGPVDTSFALLVLKRSNRASDLTAVIRNAVDRNELPLLPGIILKTPEQPRRMIGPSPMQPEHLPTPQTPEIRREPGQP
jgi:hypothetical protein